jgi:hypothetical protein
VAFFGNELSIGLYWALLPVVLSSLYARVSHPLAFASIQWILLSLNVLAGFLVGPTQASRQMPGMRWPQKRHFPCSTSSERTAKCERWMIFSPHSGQKVLLRSWPGVLPM